MRKDGDGTIEPMATVLVVDDEPIVREVVVRYLGARATRRSRRATATSARELVERERPTSSCST